MRTHLVQRSVLHAQWTWQCWSNKLEGWKILLIVRSSWLKGSDEMFLRNTHFSLLSFHTYPKAFFGSNSSFSGNLRPWSRWLWYACWSCDNNHLGYISSEFSFGKSLIVIFYCIFVCCYCLIFVLTKLKTKSWTMVYSPRKWAARTEWVRIKINTFHISVILAISLTSCPISSNP